MNTTPFTPQPSLPVRGEGAIPDVNFAIHLPVIDRIFGTYYLPPEWPGAYGIDGDPVPARYPAQVLYPFRPLFARSR